MKVLAFAAINSSNSINQQLARYAANLVPDAVVETLDINDYEMPIFSDKREQQLGQPDQAKAFCSNGLLCPLSRFRGAVVCSRTFFLMGDLV